HARFARNGRGRKSSADRGRERYQEVVPRRELAEPAEGDDFLGVQESDSDRSWRIVRAAADAAARAADANQPAAFAIDGDGALSPVPVGDTAALFVWRPDTGWQTALPVTDPRAPLIDLYLPVCSATIAHPITIGHLGQ